MLDNNTYGAATKLNNDLGLQALLSCCVEFLGLQSAESMHGTSCKDCLSLGGSVCWLMTKALKGWAEFHSPGETTKELQDYLTVRHADRAYL